VLLEVGFFLYLGSFARFPKDVVVLSSLTFAMVLGLCLQSHIFRYCGGVLFLVWGGSFIWTTYSGLPRTPALNSVYFFILGALHLFVGGILLFSKSFKVEFERMRNAESSRRAYFRKIFVIVVGAAIVIGLSQDTLRTLFNESRDVSNRP
jgi:hypothetical protein